MALTIGELVGYLDLDSTRWERGERKAHRDMRSLRDDVDTLSDRSNHLAGSFLSLANNLSNIPTAMQAVAGTATILANMSGAIGLLPAAGVGAAIAISTLKVGVQGFGDALKNSGDPAKFAESLKTLAPEARETAIAVHDLRDEWSGLQQAVQNNLFENLAPHVKKLGETYIPVVRKGMFGIAADFNYGAQKTAQFLEKGEQVNAVKNIFASTRKVTGELGQAMQPLVSILLDIVAVGSEFLPGLSGGFGDAAQRAAEFVRNARETGQLHKWISTGLSTIGDLVKLLKNLGGIAVRVFGGLNAGGTNMLQTLIKVTDQIKEFLDSAQGHAALKALGQALNAVSTVVTQVMLTALRELAPLVVELAPSFAELAKQVGSILVTAIRIAAPLLHLLAGFIADNIDWLGPLAIALYGAVQAFQALSTVMKIVQVLAATNPWLLLIAATIALAVLIITHWEQIKAALAAAWEWIKNTARTAWEHIKSAIVDPIVSAAKWVWQKIQDIGAWFASLPGKILDALKDLGRIIAAPFVWAWEKISKLFADVLEGIARIRGELNTGFQTGTSVTNRIATQQTRGTGGHMFRAEGGPVMAGRSYWVGEKGVPELYTPGANGYITPLDKMGAGATVHIEQFNAYDGQSPRDISEELLWDAKTGG